jgi:hypothetical protein
MYLSKEPPCPSELDLVKRERKLAAVCDVSLELIKRDRVGRGVHGVLWWMWDKEM